MLEMQGYIFFGTSTLLVNRIRARLNDSRADPPEYVLLDFRRVTGIDSSVSLSLGKLAQYGSTYGFTLLVTGLSPPLRAVFERLVKTQGEPGRIRLFPDLDHGLEHAENQLLAAAAADGVVLEETFERRLRGVGGGDRDLAVLSAYAERRTYAEGEPLIRQGEVSRDLFFIERGSVTVHLSLPEGRSVRLRTMGAGTVVGEVAVYLRLPRSASVVADGETTVVRISGEALAEMHRQDPAAAALLHAFMARELAEKLLAATQQLAAIYR
jgi:sulfate permease, SulP family